MSNTIIRVESLGKKYLIKHQQQGSYIALRDVITDKVKSFGRKIISPWNHKQSSTYSTTEEFWALKDISFKVKQGEVIGIIGRNGAGKSTLLKIISRITEPTKGRIRINGRVASLLEVGTGFHPELTGRENIFLNGAILGMGKAEIKRKFDEIVAFAEIEKFLDTPVKRYSSGMYVRLAFAVAAHLEPEILLVDEVLAVGDAAFQKKCLGKMGDISQEGRTLLFVSHNMVAIQSLCDRTILLNDGRIMEEGPSNRVISGYLQRSFPVLTKQVWDDINIAPGNNLVRLHRLWITPEDGSSSDQITMQTALQIGIEFWNLIPNTFIDVTLHIYTEDEIIAFGSGTVHETVRHGSPFPKGLFRSVCHIPDNLLNSGKHRIKLLIVKDQGTVIYSQENILSFEVVDSLDARGAWYGKLAGAVRPRLKWTTELVDKKSMVSA